MSRPPASVTVASVHEPVMGTYLQLQVTARDEAAATAAEEAILAEASRLESALSRFRPDSDLVRWMAGEADATPELTELLQLAQDWYERTGGAFHPATAALTDRWHRAEAEGTAPGAPELAELVAAAAELPFLVGPDREVVRRGDCRTVDLHSLAKGHVVDLLARHALAHHDVERLVINAGGDILHRGTGVLRVGVEDPLAAYDNRPPARRIAVADRAVATSGTARRGFSVGGRRRSRLLDPRTGQPVDRAASATVVAADAATADVLATTAAVLGHEEASGLLGALRAELGVAWLLIDADGGEHPGPGWGDLEI